MVDVGERYEVDDDEADVGIDADEVELDDVVADFNPKSGSGPTKEDLLEFFEVEFDWEISSMTIAGG